MTTDVIEGLGEMRAVELKTGGLTEVLTWSCWILPLFLLPFSPLFKETPTFSIWINSARENLDPGTPDRAEVEKKHAHHFRRIGTILCLNCENFLALSFFFFFASENLTTRRVPQDRKMEDSFQKNKQHVPCEKRTSDNGI